MTSETKQYLSHLQLDYQYLKKVVHQMILEFANKKENIFQLYLA